jgi:hypothetical protein
MCTPSNAQSDRTITIRMLESKTGTLVTPTKFQVNVNTKDYSHLESISPNKDGLGELVVKGDVTMISIQALYQPGDHIFVNCDMVKDTVSFLTHWYEVPEIFSTGTVAPNRCSKLKAVAKPGEFIFFIRPMNWYEKLKQ